MYGGYGYMHGPEGLIFHGLAWLVLLALVIGGAVLVVRALGHGGSRLAGGSALARLEERYANGEIDREEFLQKKKDLGR